MANEMKLHTNLIADQKFLIGNFFSLLNKRRQDIIAEIDEKNLSS